MLDGYQPALRAGYEVQSRTHHATTWLADTQRMARVLVHHRIELLPILVEGIERRLPGTLRDLEAFWRNRAADLGVPMPVFVPPPRWTP